MNYPLVAKDTFIYGSTGELIAVMEPGPFAQGRINARDLVELANLGHRTRQHEAELRNLTEIKGEPSFAFSPSVMVEFTAEEFANFQTGLGALRQLSRRTETPQEKKVEPASNKGECHVWGWNYANQEQTYENHEKHIWRESFAGIMRTCARCGKEEKLK